MDIFRIHFQARVFCQGEVRRNGIPTANRTRVKAAFARIIRDIEGIPGGTCPCDRVQGIELLLYFRLPDRAEADFRWLLAADREVVGRDYADVCGTIGRYV